jgi:hypothetical protein
MAAVVIGVDPHKGSHTAVVIDQAEAVAFFLSPTACFCVWRGAAPQPARPEAATLKP